MVMSSLRDAIVHPSRENTTPPSPPSLEYEAGSYFRFIDVCLTQLLVCGDNATTDTALGEGGGWDLASCLTSATTVCSILSSRDALPVLSVGSAGRMVRCGTLIMTLHHPGVEWRANLRPIPHRCHVICMGAG